MRNKLKTNNHFSISILLAYNNNLYSVFVPLLGANYIITANSSVTFTARAKLGIFFIGRNALSEL